MTFIRALVRGSLPLVIGAALLAPSAQGSAPGGATSSSPITALISACHACHGRDGVSEGADVPNLAGQKLDYLVRQLESFRSGERKNALMAAVAGQLSDAEIRALATIWSQMPGARSADRPAPTPAAIHSRMVFPAAFPEGFTLYETTDPEPDGSFAKRYANELALRSLREGKPLAQGATLIVANLANPRDVSSYAGMQSRAGWGADVPVLLRNDDWDYAMFGADRARRDTLNQAPCLACHKPQAADSFIFTIKALRARAARPANDRAP
jgi:cytochrome c553